MNHPFIFMCEVRSTEYSTVESRRVEHRGVSFHVNSSGVS